MELKTEYKQTEVGVIPKEWDVSTVGHEFEVKLGKMLDAAKNIGIPKPYLGNRAVQWDRIDIAELPTVPMSRSDIERFRLKKGDLLVCEGGEVGRAAIWNASIEECYYQKALHRLRPLRGFDQRLMVALLHQWSDRGLLANYVTQTSIAHLPREKFMEVPMPVPSPSEQRAIAEALSDVDALLGALDRLIAKKRDLKQAAIQQLMTGNTRLPGFHGDWEVKSLAATCSMKSGEGITSAAIDQISKYPCYGGNGLRGFTSRFTHDGRHALIGRQGALCGNVFGVERQFFASEHAIVVTASVKTDIRWLTYMLGRMNLNQYSESSAQPGLSVSKILNLDVAYPPTKEEQTAIAALLTDMDMDLAALEQRLAKTRNLKQAMMQELLTGKTRLVSPELSHA
jgi:type I restriction enzyme, S subunit